MQIRNSRSVSYDTLLDCRVAMLGLDLFEIKNRCGETFEAITRRCKACEFGETCEFDLKRDPNDPVWETYCPNSATFLALVDSLNVAGKKLDSLRL